MARDTTFPLKPKRVVQAVLVWTVCCAAVTGSWIMSLGVTVRPQALAIGVILVGLTVASAVLSAVLYRAHHHKWRGL